MVCVLLMVREVFQVVHNMLMLSIDAKNICFHKIPKQIFLHLYSNTLYVNNM